MNVHHAVYAQEIRSRRPKMDRGHGYDAVASASASQAAALKDKRNLLPVAFGCHMDHHNRGKPFALAVLPDSVYEFAVELMGAGAAYEYLRRRYAGEDGRLDALLS